jgi:hypothetical protein
MKTLHATGLLATLFLPFVVTAASDASSVEQKLMQMERDYAVAIVKKDTATLDKIFADDYVNIGADGMSETKAEGMAAVKSGSLATQSIELGPMKVRVFGNSAVVTGSDTEKSSYEGKDTSGKYAWTDVWVMRKGQWQAVASQATKLEK